MSANDGPRHLDGVEQVDLASAMSKERWRDTSLHREVKNFATDYQPADDEWYPRNILPAAEAPWHSVTTDCLQAPEEQRPHSSTRESLWYEDGEIEPQLDPHLQGHSTGFGLHSWRPLWSTATAERFHDTFTVNPALGDSSYVEDIALERQSIKGASPDCLATVDSDGRYKFSDNISYHSFYHNPKIYVYAIPRTWYHSTPHEHGHVSHSGKLLRDTFPSDITERPELQQKWNGRKQWKTLGSISGGFQYHYSSDEVFEQEEDQRSWKETVEDPEYSEWTYGRPSHDLAWDDRNRYLQEGCSCTRKHGVRYHGAGGTEDVGVKNEVPWKTESAPGLEEENCKTLVIDADKIEEFYGKQKPDYNQYSTEQYDIPDDTEEDKILVPSEHFSVEADELPQNTETMPDGVLDGEKLFSELDSGKQMPEYVQTITEQVDNPDDKQDHNIFVHSQDSLVQADELLQRTETVLDDGLNDEKLNPGPLDHVGERQCEKEDDEFGHYVIRCNEGYGDVKGQEDTILSDNFFGETDVKKVKVEEDVGSEPHDDTSDAKEESVGNHKWKNDVLEPSKCSKNEAESDNISTEKTEDPATIEIISEESKLNLEPTDHVTSPVEGFYGKQKAGSKEYITERDDEPASLQAQNDVINSDDFVTEIPWVMEALSETGKREVDCQDRIGNRVAVSYGQKHGLFGHRESSIEDSFENIKIYGDSLHTDILPGKANAAFWQAKLNPVEEKWKSEPTDHVALWHAKVNPVEEKWKSEPTDHANIYTDESYGNRKWEQYTTAWKDMLDALKSPKAMSQSENFAGQIEEGAWNTEQMAQKEEWEADFLDQVDTYVDDSYNIPYPAWEYYSNARKGELGTSDAVHPAPSPDFAAKEVKTTWRSEDIPKGETPYSEPWQHHNIVYNSIKTESHSVLEDGPEADTLYLEWGSGEESEYESFSGVNVQSHVSHGNQKITPEQYITKWTAPFDAAENQDPIKPETFSVEAASFPRSHKLVHEDETNRHGTIGHAGGAPDASFRIKRPLEWYKPVNWRTVSDGITYQASGAEKTQWDEYVQRKALAEDEAVDRTAATDRLIYDAGTSARGPCNFGTHQLPQKEYVSYESHETIPATDCENVVKPKLRTALGRSKVNSWKTPKKWRDGVEAVALPFEWPEKKIIAGEDEHLNAESEHYTGRELCGAEESTREVDEVSWTVGSGRGASQEGWSSDGGSSSEEWADSAEWSSEDEKGGGDRAPAVAPITNLIESLVRVFSGPIKKVAGYARRSWKERKAARSRSRADDACLEPRTAVTPAPPPRLRPGRRRRPLEARKRGRARLRGLAGRLLAGACGGGGRTTVHLTMPRC